MLLIGFSLLIGLIGLTGIGALRRAGGAYRDISALNERYVRTERGLNAVRGGIYMVGVLARDYLLDPSNAHAADYRAQLLAERSAMEEEMRQLEGAVQSENRPELDRLRKEVEGYWDALDPLFTWTPEEKALRSWGFLRREVLRRREAASSLAREISLLAQTNLQKQRQEIDERQNSMASFMRRMLTITVLLGIVIAGITVLRMTRLENRSEEERHRAEAAEQELRRLSRQLVQAQEAERKSISRELHDEVGQTLTALRMELRSLQELRTAPKAEFDEHVDGAKQLTEQSIRALKDMAMGLRPSMLDDLGLGSAVQWQARQFSKHTGIPVNVDVDGIPPGLPERHRTCVYRVVQEALTNSARHAHAKTIRVDVAAKSGQLSVAVKDDGVGFDPAQVRGRGLGLIGMQERVMELGGELTLASQSLKGTAVLAKIPFEEATRDASSNSAG